MSMDDVAHTWIKSRSVIAGFLMQIRAGMDCDWYETMAAAIIARLASCDPPLVIATIDELKE